MLDAELLLTMRAAVAAQPIIPTISDGRPNWVQEVTPDGVWVETERSRQLGRPAQLVPAWMIQIAWEYLASHGTLTNRYLLADDGLNVKRSSFCLRTAGHPARRDGDLAPADRTAAPRLIPCVTAAALGRLPFRRREKPSPRMAA